MTDFEVRTLLPVKQKDGKWIYPTESVPTNNGDISEDDMPTKNDDCSDDSTEECQTGEVVEPRNLIEHYANEHKKLKNLKARIGILCSAVTEDPEKNMRALKELVFMLRKSNTKMIVTEKKLLALSLYHVFSDVLPGYKIRSEQQADKKKKVKLKKETKVLIGHESSLLRYYKKYLDCLQGMVNDMKPKAQKGKLSAVQKKAVHEIGVVAARSLCDLLTSRYYFNYCKTILNIVIPLACNRDTELSELCCNGIAKLYKVDKLGESSLEAVRLTVKVIKERKFNVPPLFLQTFLSLKLQEAKVNDKKEKTDMKKIRKQLNLMSRKEKRHKKKMLELENQLRETEAQESKETKSKLQAEMLKRVFWVYFHVLKDDTKMTLVAPVLEGLSTFAHLINLEFFDDLSSVLSSLMESGKLSNIEKLHGMQTLFTILSGQAESLNVDPQHLYNHLYNILIDLQNCVTPEYYQAALQCIDVMVVKRKKKITYNRLLAFMKRLCTVSVQSPLPFTLAALCIVRIMLINTKSSDILLDTENSIGSGVYLPELEDPEYCNPASAALWDLHLLLKHYNPVVANCACHILHGCPMQGRLQLPDKLTKLLPQEILQEFSDVVDQHKIEPERCKNPAKKLRGRKGVPEDVNRLMDMDTSLAWEHVTDVDFVNCKSE